MPPKRKRIRLTDVTEKMKDLNQEWVKRGGFASDVYTLARNLEESFVQTPQDVTEVAEGAVKCRKCSNYRLRFFDIQMRGSDEKSTVCYKCLNPECNHTWSE
jgi:DNA-directed RNA polymerase subunit M/transcription elongation factor TFIIS